MNREKRYIKMKNFYIFIFIFSFSIFSSAFPVLAQDSTTSATPSATTPSNSVRDKVRKTIENLTRKPRAVVGNLSDIADTTLQIKTRDNEAVMVSVTKDTSYIRVAANKRTEIKFSELVLDDFIIAMGTRNGNGVLEASRLITYDKSPLKIRRAVYGTVAQNKSGTLTINLPTTGETWTIKTTSKTDVTAKVDGKMSEVKASSIEVGSRIVATGTPDEKQTNTLLANRLHAIPVP